MAIARAAGADMMAADNRCSGDACIIVTNGINVVFRYCNVKQVPILLTAQKSQNALIGVSLDEYLGSRKFDFYRIEIIDAT